MVQIAELEAERVQAQAAAEESVQAQANAMSAVQASEEHIMSLNARLAEGQQPAETRQVGEQHPLIDLMYP